MKKKTKITIKNFPRILKKIKFNLVLNYIEFLYNLKMGILLYKPVLGEILLINKKRMLSFCLIKNKILFLYFKFFII